MWQEWYYGINEAIEADYAAGLISREEYEAQYAANMAEYHAEREVREWKPADPFAVPTGIQKGY